MSSPSITRQDFGTGRTYKIEVPATVLELPSVTNILGILGKPALPNWAAKVTREGVAELVRNGASRDEMADQQKIADLLKSEGLGHNQKRDSAAERGQGVHDFAQAIASGAEVEAINPYCKAFQDWWDADPLRKVIFTEMPVYSIRDGYAGTADLGTTLDLIDYKTRKAGAKAYDSDYLQTAAYRRAVREMTGANLFPMVLVLRQDGTYEEFRSPNPDEDERAFLALFETWKWRTSRGFR